PYLRLISALVRGVAARYKDECCESCRSESLYIGHFPSPRAARRLLAQQVAKHLLIIIEIEKRLRSAFYRWFDFDYRRCSGHRCYCRLGERQNSGRKRDVLNGLLAVYRAACYDRSRFLGPAFSGDRFSVGINRLRRKSSIIRKRFCWGSATTGRFTGG